MHHKKHTTVFDKLYFPKKPNYEYVSEYFASNASDAHRSLGAYNCGDNIERNVEITNYLVRRQLTKTTKKLEHKRKDYNDKRKKVLEQWADLRDKESSFRENFIKFNQFVKENQEKKERAANKIVEQNQLKEEREKRMNELLKKCEDITYIKTKMDTKIGQYRIYEEFLLKVIDREASMQCIGDLLRRYEALVGARKELNDIQQRDMMKLEKAKSNLRELTQRYLNKLASMNNHMISLQERYEKARHESKKWDRVHKYIEVEATGQLIDTVAIKEASQKMYLEICGRKKMKPVHVNNAGQQLSAIKQAIGEYEIINRRVKEIEEKAQKESIEPKASDSS